MSNTGIQEIPMADGEAVRARHSASETTPHGNSPGECLPDPGSAVQAEAEASGSPRAVQTAVASDDARESKTAFFTSEICDRHNVPSHPECFQRAVVIRERITKDFPSIHVVNEIQEVTEAQLLAFHTKHHVDNMLTQFRRVHESFHLPGNNGQPVMIDIDGDTTIMQGTEGAAMVAAGAVCKAIDLVMSESSNVVNAFCGVRPPGHHAEPHQAMGFCVFNNVGIGACHLLDRYSDEIKRVLILDFDVHHGNGTQAKFLTNYPQVCFVSTHQGQFYPFTGTVNERGTHDNIVNVPLAPRTPSPSYRKHFTSKVLPVMHAFRPDFVLVSAGFDAHRLDPLADVALETEDYYWITKHVTEIAKQYANGRIVSSLEGGYHLEALADSAAAHVRALVEAAGNWKPTSETARDETAASVDVDALTSAFAAAVTLDAPPQELRVTVHYDSKEKLLVLKDRTTKFLLQQCKNKFPTLKKKAKTIAIQDAHGTLVTDHTLRSLPHDRHLYLR